MIEQPQQSIREKQTWKDARAVAQQSLQKSNLFSPEQCEAMADAMADAAYTAASDYVTRAIRALLPLAISQQ